MVDSTSERCPGPGIVAQAHIITAQLPCLTLGIRCLCWHAVFGFHLTWCYELWQNIFTLVLSIQRTSFKKSYGLLRCSFANLNCVTMFFLERRGFLTGNPSKQAILVWSFYNCTVMIFFFFCSLSEHFWIGLGVNLLGDLLWGWLATILCDYCGSSTISSHLVPI